MVQQFRVRVVHGFICKGIQMFAFHFNMLFVFLLQTLATNPKCVLTPFMLSALLTICNVSRYLESVRLSVSSALPFIRTVIQNNEKEVELCNNSAWFRDTLENSTVNVNKVYSILIEQR